MLIYGVGYNVIALVIYDHKRARNHLTYKMIIFKISSIIKVYLCMQLLVLI